MGRLNAILNWSARVGTLFGIPINLHITLLFFLLPALAGRKWDIWHSLEWVVLVVLSILLHELGHALTAKRYGLKGLSIMLHGFGGFAMSTGARTPKQSLTISLMGPAVTFVLGFACLGIGYYGGRSAEPYTEPSIQLFLIEGLGRLNLMLGVLNMMPMLPFDGGQSLQAIFSKKLGEFKAMRAVGHIGLVVGPILIIFGVFTSQGFVTIFGLMGLLTSLQTLLNSGGVRFGEFAADRRNRLELEAVKKQREERSQAYLGNVMDRAKEREEKERLRKILEASLDED